MPGILDKIKARFPKKVKVGFNPSLETEKAEVHIGHKYSITINQFGDNPKSEKISDSFEEGEILTKDEVILPEVEQTKTVITKSQLLKRYKLFLKKRDLAALNNSLSIVDLEDREMNAEAKKQHKLLIEAFADRGAAIYNFTRSGLFETEIMNRLNQIKKEHKEINIKAIDEFNNYFEGIIKRHPTNIYVGKFRSENDIVDEIQSRIDLLAKGEINLIKIYCREPQRSLVNSICNQLEEVFDIKTEEYRFGKNKAHTFYLIPKTDLTETST